MEILFVHLSRIDVDLRGRHILYALLRSKRHVIVVCHLTLEHLGIYDLLVLIARLYHGSQDSLASSLLLLLFNLVIAVVERHAHLRLFLLWTGALKAFFVWATNGILEAETACGVHGSTSAIVSDGWSRLWYLLNGLKDRLINFLLLGRVQERFVEHGLIEQAYLLAVHVADRIKCICRIN